jgi:hypothetical protein
MASLVVALLSTWAEKQRLTNWAGNISTDQVEEAASQPNELKLVAVSALTETDLERPGAFRDSVEFPNLFGARQE